MIRRCTDDEHTMFETYGGRGITYTSRWDDFDLFIEDMGHRPAGHTLDRINPEDGYHEANCRWSTPEEQANNRRSNVYVSYCGESLTYAQLGRKLGMSADVLRLRIRVRGWTVERAVSTPVRRYTRRR